MAHFADSPPKTKKNSDKILEFLNNYYKDFDNFGCGKMIRNNHINDVKMMGELVDNNPFAILAKNRYDNQTIILVTHDIKCIESDIKEYLMKTDGWEISHLFYYGDKIGYNIEIAIWGTPDSIVT